MGSLIRGRAHVFPRPHINTDEIIPARYLNTHDEKELAKRVMEDIDPDFSRRVQPGDIIIAGNDFGCGSSREHAVWALRGAGIAAVLAPSFARIFFRNALNNGFVAIECADAPSAAVDGDQIEINLDLGTIINLSSNSCVQFTPLTAFALEMLHSGGLLPLVAKQVRPQASPWQKPAN
ncbi:MAG: 3-isopropylmalate dehydratase small subunit [Blastocatellia bacterium]